MKVMLVGDNFLAYHTLSLELRVLAPPHPKERFFAVSHPRRTKQIGPNGTSKSHNLNFIDEEFRLRRAARVFQLPPILATFSTLNLNAI